MVCLPARLLCVPPPCSSDEVEGSLFLPVLSRLAWRQQRWRNGNSGVGGGAGDTEKRQGAPLLANRGNNIGTVLSYFSCSWA